VPLTWTGAAGEDAGPSASAVAGAASDGAARSEIATIAPVAGDRADETVVGAPRRRIAQRVQSER
jgi:hypothetical protein